MRTAAICFYTLRWTRRLSEQGFPMRLPVRLETTVRTENRTAGAVPDALYALKGAILLSTASAV